MTSIQNAIEDELGDVERLAIYNLLPTVAPNDILPFDAIVAVKEPYYKRTADGGLIVRVDHPSDVVPLKPGNQTIPSRLAPQTRKLDPSALSLKENGNTAFKRGNWQQAVDYYSDALEAANLAGDNDLRRTLHLNRAAARLRLGHYELTMTDALASIVPAENTSKATKDANMKALYRVGKAAYEMGDFLKAKWQFEQALELDTQDKGTGAELSRIRERLAEQENGDYNFSVMAKSATRDHTRLDHASFLKNTQVAPAGRRGRGLFATKALKPGDVVFVEKAFHAAYPADNGDISVLINYNTNRVSVGTQALCLYGLVDKILWNPMLANKYLDLYDSGKFGNKKEAKVVDGKVAVNTFQVQSIADFNGFGCPRVKSSDKEVRVKEGSDHETGTGIWAQASYANHSCLPNAARAFVGDMMVVRALKDIRAMEEIFMGYISPTEPLSKRQKRMREGYGFDCDCAMCQAEAKVHKTIMEKRALIRKKIGMFLPANPLTNSNFQTVPLAKRAEAKKLLEEIRETYPQSLFERLPRPDCIYIGLWISQSAGGPAKDGLSKSLSVLRDIGYLVTVQGNRVVVDRENALPMEAAIHAALHASQALAAIGNEDAASTLEALAREVYTSLFGVDDGFETEFGSTPSASGLSAG